MARIVGKDALPPRQQHVLLCAELINEAFLRQSAFSEADRFCPVGKQIAMMQVIDPFYRFVGGCGCANESVWRLSMRCR